MAAVRAGNHELSAVKSCTKAGTGCGGCSNLGGGSDPGGPGVEADKGCASTSPTAVRSCYHLARVGELKSFEALPGTSTARGWGATSASRRWPPSWRRCGTSTCWRSPTALQDTNDAFLANLQRTAPIRWCRASRGDHPGGAHHHRRGGAKYGLTPRSPAASASILFGARVDQLPAIWGELVAAGFETGQAYGKSVRTVKSRGFHLVSLRGAGLHDPDPDPGTLLLGLRAPTS